MMTDTHTTEMRQSEASAQELIRLAQSVISQTRSLMLPHHFNIIDARLVTFQEVKLLKNKVIGRIGSSPIHVLLVSKAGQKITLTRQQTIEDTLIIDISAVTPTVEAMQHFLLETESSRRWHHAPRIAVSKVRLH